MEARTMVCDRAQPPQPLPHEPPHPDKKKRVRRWHHRGFTGCSTCRRRHVRCDEASPTCRNCTRLGLECDGSQGRMTFKVYGPPPPPPGQSNPPTKRDKSRPRASQKAVKKEDTEVEGVVISPTTVTESKPLVFHFENPAVHSVTSIPEDDKKVKKEQEDEDLVLIPTAGESRPTEVRFHSHTLPVSSLDCLQGRYYTHFVDEVATLLLIYDTSTNINPFRRCFPDVSQSSLSMASAMEALGALHLANTSTGPERIVHFQHAMGKYGEVVKSFRTRYEIGQRSRLPDFATCLLLALFEMMDSQHHNWAIHLKGAREIYRWLFYPNSDPVLEAQRVAEMNHPLRQFLVSLLSYLDVAGACATSDGTVVEGSYWQTLGGGWEYNLGIPSLSQPAANNGPLLELRQCWSIMMEIQAAISSFGKAKQSGWLTPDQQDIMYRDLLQRLVQWRLDAPQCLQKLRDLDDASLSQYPHPDVLEYAGCIEAYEKATNIYLHKVGRAGRPDIQPQQELIAAFCTRILSLIRKLAKDVGRLAVPWPLFVAGRETRDEREQKFVRDTMLDMQRYGFKNVEKALEELEKAWFKRRAFPEGWVETMDDVRSSILLP
ncbi:protein sfgA [Aspergillus nidulans FGSC A4]|uniref:Zn(2)-C6 fungal-type domain-containing protein n=2 Tax=Emericella nidulans TaxID=162425 RepID=C8V6P1_EMENI|nr:protein sfgA [Aspergillus nidulans FGSC A4]AAY99779.1 SfgA [Aspergillus nidulans]CBF73944.1 TPA: SfgA [Source:UniProtKB/TrEMBL;Acc:Q3I5F3] [Aspergillus nidulans FGSC A4]